jgi:hypothetical protein
MTRNERYLMGRERRAIFRRVFVESQDGRTVLALILNRCGYFSLDPSIVSPELISLSNYILAEMGSINTANIYGLADAIAKASNDADLDEYLSAGDRDEEVE